MTDSLPYIHTRQHTLVYTLKQKFFVDDFKPESLDSTKSSTVTVGDNNSVTVSVPHVQVSDNQ